jgi:hypothetical protein
MGWTVRGSKPGKRREIFYLPEYTDGLWANPSLYSMGTGDPSLR